MDNIKNNLKEYVNFLQKYNIIGFSIGLMIAGSVVEFSNATIDSIVLPTLEPLLKRNNNYIIKIGSIQINLEKFIKSLSKLFILTIIIFLFFKFGININLTTVMRSN
jgi:large-conductance mechanosensitive channel